MAFGFTLIVIIAESQFRVIDGGGGDDDDDEDDDLSFFISHKLALTPCARDPLLPTT